MRYFLALALVFSFFLHDSLSLAASAAEVGQTERQVPPYAKWGQIAMSRVREKYPQAEIIDYLHIGRQRGTSSSTEKFKLWLKQGEKEFGVFVDITFDNKTEKIREIKLRETTR